MISNTRSLLVALAVLLGAFWLISSSAARADGFGLTFADGGDVTGSGGSFFETSTGAVPESECGVEVTTCTTLNTLELNAALTSYSNSFTLSSASSSSAFSGSIVGVPGSINGVALGAYSQAVGSATSNGDLYWFDTFNLTPGEYQVTLTLDGTVIGGSANNSLSLEVNQPTIEPAQNYQQAVLTVVAGQSGTYTLDETSDTSVTLAELLVIRNTIDGGSVTIDEQDPGYFTVTPLTAGASYTTASGISYLEPPGVPTTTPEPSSLPLFSTGLAALGLLALWRTPSAQA